MNTFVLKKFSRRKQLTYYKVQVDQAPQCEFDDFVMRMSKVSHERRKRQYERILAALDALGATHGADTQQMRNEHYGGGTAWALPGYDEKGLGPRLYCIVLSPRIVVLVNGDFKTKNTAQECPNVRPHFLLANSISIALNNELAKYINLGITTDDSELEFDEDYTFTYTPLT